MTIDSNFGCPTHPQSLTSWRRVDGFRGEHACCYVCLYLYDARIREQVEALAASNKAAVVICIQDGKVLMVQSRKRPGSTELPGGSLLPNEDFANAAARELWEECGLYVDVEDLSLVHVKNVRGWTVHIYQASQWCGQLRHGGDIETCGFEDPELLLTGEHAEDYETIAKVIGRGKEVPRDGE